MSKNKYVLICLICILLFGIYKYYNTRNIYNVNKNLTLTVWHTFGGTYLIPNKYLSFNKPQNGYLHIKDIPEITLYIDSINNIIYFSPPSLKYIISNSSNTKEYKFINCDSTYEYIPGDSNTTCIIYSGKINMNMKLTPYGISFTSPFNVYLEDSIGRELNSLY